MKEMKRLKRLSGKVFINHGRKGATMFSEPFQICKRKEQVCL
jgi:hypothetical protein